MPAIRDIAVMRVGDDGVARFSFGHHPRFISGRERVASHFIQVLLTRPGSIAWSKHLGGGLMELAGGIVDEGALHTAVAAAVSKSTRDVLTEQGQHSVDPSDKMASVQILEARFEASSRTYFLKLEILTESGESVIVNL